MGNELNRHQSREVAVQLLYQMDINKEDIDENLEILKKECPEIYIEDSFLLNIIKGTYKEMDKIDQLINNNIAEWKVERMAKVDRNIIRLSLYEIFFEKEIPLAVSVNEAVELAKSFSDEQSAKFVNGILGKIIDKMNLKIKE